MLIPSLYWIATGSGAAPSSAAPEYPSLIQAAFRVVFLIAPLFALAGMALMRAPKTTPTEGDVEPFGPAAPSAVVGGGNHEIPQV